MGASISARGGRKAFRITNRLIDKVADVLRLGSVVGLCLHPFGRDGTSG